MGRMNENGTGLNLAAIAQPGALLDQGGSRDLQVTKIMQFFRDQLIRLQRQSSSHAGQAARIHRIRLGPRPAGLRKAACLQGIDLHER